MTDHRRMEWQAWANRIASWMRILCILAMADEVYEIIEHHWPLWTSIALPLTLIIHEMARFVDNHTRIYRMDL